MVAYFDMLKRSLRAAPRSIVLENLRPLFKVFVEAFDVPSQLPLDDATEVLHLPAPPCPIAKKTACRSRGIQ